MKLIVAGLFIMLQFLSLSKFKWITIISHSMYSTFTQQNVAFYQSALIREDNHRKFLKNLFYGFALVPFLFSSPAIFILILCPDYFIATIQEDNCSLTFYKINSQQLRIFLLGPASVMILMNFLFFVLVVISIIKNRNQRAAETRRLQRNLTNSSQATRILSSRINGGRRVSTRMDFLGLFFKLHGL